MALEDSTLIRISREGFLNFIKEHPELALKMMSGYSKRLRQFVSKIEELSSLLGTIPETLSRSFAFLKQKGLVVEKDNLIIIPDPDKLKLFSKSHI